MKDGENVGWSDVKLCVWKRGRELSDRQCRECRGSESSLLTYIRLPSHKEID